MPGSGTAESQVHLYFLKWSMGRTVTVFILWVVTSAIEAVQHGRICWARTNNALHFSQFPHIYSFTGTSTTVEEIGKESVLSILIADDTEAQRLGDSPIICGY